MLISLVYFVVIGILAGWLASAIMGSAKGGLVRYFIIGIIGALIGGFVFRLLGLAAYGLIGELVTATVGAILLILLLRKL